MDTTKKRDWGLIVAGILLIICAAFFAVAPGLALLTITAIAGAAFLVSGVFDVISYNRFRKAMNLSGWALAYAVLDIVLGILFLIHPIVSAGALAWFVGAMFIVFGAFEAVGSFRIRKTGVPMWGWMLFSGIVSVLCGVLFFMMPAMLSIFLSVFILMRGLSLIMYGAGVGKAMAA